MSKDSTGGHICLYRLREMMLHLSSLPIYSPLARIPKQVPVAWVFARIEQHNKETHGIW